ncbi:sigma-70 family RNA polymerase sigma factor [Algoriphagus sp. H41]|uniref:Sigma-70 family RNA polymerase sigma factor n=1 Tax=Algoriphagus oliviformis TaxID=2811231 RepID=A0ABS3C2Z2_9BACT|nr:sigma-70 family RNA polymerase sigma factor [Algoriphagus oliviformis]MBN7811245.1 sigma-70 family RNA polymerase sigma factor [Algoriphagus oliviformis]
MFFIKATDSSGSEDCALWESVKKGNELAFSSLFKKFVNPLYNYGMHFFPDPDLAKDCVQELFTSVWQKRESLSEVSLVKGYLFRSYRNLFFAKIAERKKDVHPDFWEEEVLEAEDSKESEWIEEEEAIRNCKLVQHAVRELTRRQREAVVLRFYNGMESRQIAEVMGISVEAVHNLISKAIRLLREKLRRQTF